MHISEGNPFVKVTVTSFMTTSSSTLVKSSFPSPSPPRWKYDVFLSFRGEDVRKGFLGHLYSNLDRRGLRVFKDEKELAKGEPIKTELLDAIKVSNVSVIVFSRNYADSRWCLDELKEIMKCKHQLGQEVLPVFFHVEPSDVRKQTRSFEEAFSRLREFPQQEIELWKNALTQVADFSGLHLQNDANGDESKLIKKIVRQVEAKITPTYSIEDDYIVGIDNQVKEIISRLRLDLCTIHFLGIFGMTGIGKTAIAKSIRSKISLKFDSTAFLEDVSGSLEEGLGLIGLQKKLLCDILKLKDVSITDTDVGAMEIKRRLQRKKILVILDNVDHIHHLDALAKDKSWFGLGSRIIITCKDEQLLKQINVNDRYQVGLLSYIESLRLFSWHAFGQEYPIEGYVQLSKDLVNNVKGHPLALKLMGRTLSGFKKDKSQWISACDKLKSIPHKDILNQLKKCFDSLEDAERDVFLDIAVILKGMDVSQAVEILDNYEKHPKFFITTLVQKCLIGITKGTLTVHDLFSQMAKEIVRGEAPDDPGKRSRIWFYKESRKVLKYHEGSTKVKGFLGNFPKPKEDTFDAEAFSNMKNLRLLHLRNANIDGDFDCFSKQLRWLCWDGFPMKSIPQNLCLKKLVVLEMRYSNLERMWNERKIMKCLKILDLSHSHKLITTSDLSGLKAIEKLILEDCIELVEVHESVFSLGKLISLNLKGCTKLENLLMSFVKPSSLTTLDLSHYAMLFSPLKTLKLHRNLAEATKQIFTHLEQYFPFFISNFKNLVRSPASRAECSRESPDPLPCVANRSLRVWTMQSLESLDLSDCNLSEKSFPRDLEGMANLKYLYLIGNKFNHLPIGLTCLQNLSLLEASNCDLSGEAPALVFKRSPGVILLHVNNFRTLPISGLSGCRHLSLYRCRYLKEIVGVPNGMALVLYDCFSLWRNEISPDKSKRRSPVDDVRGIRFGGERLSGYNKDSEMPGVSWRFLESTELRELENLFELEPLGGRQVMMYCNYTHQISKVPLQMYLENGIKNIFIPAAASISKIPEIFKHARAFRRLPSSITETQVPPAPPGGKINGFVLCCVYTEVVHSEELQCFPGELNFYAQVENLTLGTTIEYHPTYIGVSEKGDESLWISRWSSQNLFNEGDKIRVTAASPSVYEGVGPAMVRPGFGITACGFCFDIEWIEHNAQHPVKQGSN